MQRHRFVPLVTTLAVLAAAPEARAQHADSSSIAAPVGAVTIAGPIAPATQSAVRAVPAAATRDAGAAAADAPLRAVRAREAGRAAAQAGSQRDGKVYMIVGGAAFLAGALIGDDAGTIIMIGGAGVGIYGLYLYLQ
jgi:hypothetical protein